MHIDFYEMLIINAHKLFYYFMIFLFKNIYSFAVTDNAFRSLIEENKGQCVLISGKYFKSFIFFFLVFKRQYLPNLKFTYYIHTYVCTYVTLVNNIKQSKLLTIIFALKITNLFISNQALIIIVLI